MNILIVDDDPQKRNAISDFLQSRDIDPSNIDGAPDAAQARIALSHRRFDLMLVDVLLPVRQGGAPDGGVSLDLIRQIIDDGTTPSPQYIVGITADEAALRQHENEFRALTLQILPIRAGENDWMDSLDSLLAFVKRASESAVYDFDAVVMTALRRPEYEEVLTSFDASWSVERPLANGLLFREGTLAVSSGTRRIACAHMNMMGPISSTLAAGQVISLLRPRVLGMTGICGGIGDVDLGDVLIAEKTWDWQAGKWTSTDHLEPSVDQKDATPTLVGLARSNEKCLEAAHRAWAGVRPSKAPTVLSGPMVSGSSVVANSDWHAFLRHQHRKIAGVDMECYGVYYAAHGALPEPKVICIKGISDLADRQKADGIQTYCSHMSAVLMRETLRAYFQQGLA